MTTGCGKNLKINLLEDHNILMEGEACFTSIKLKTCEYSEFNGCWHLL